MTSTETASALRFDKVRFAFPTSAEGGSASPVLRDVSAEVPSGAFALLVGKTGSGKTTLLRLAKPEIAPVGARAGTVQVFGYDVSALTVADSARLVGYVFQSPDNQIVCDTVWHELAFGLENLGMDQAEMRRRMSEVCIFLGIEPWFRMRCSELSGGQRQIVALATVLAMRPRLLLLDEPTAMLDPVAEQAFLSLLFRANRELGITVVVATHHPEPMAAYATHAYALADGSVQPLFANDLSTWSSCYDDVLPVPRKAVPGTTVLRVRDAWLRYGRTGAWVLRGCDLELAAGEVRALVGGNGSGKSTLLAVAAGMLRPQRGGLRGSRPPRQALLPQEPKALLGCETVREELMEWQAGMGYANEEVEAALERLELSGSAERHPYDLSGGQQQLLALEKLLLTKPSLLLLDEPTKGLDSDACRKLALRVRALAQDGCAVLVATHDRAFIRAVAHTVSLLFDGRAGEAEDVQAFFAASWMWRP